MAENISETNVLNEENVDKSVNEVKSESNVEKELNKSNNIAIGRKISIKSLKSCVQNDCHNKWIANTVKSKDRNHWSIERSNYVTLMKLIVKQLIEDSVKTKRIVESSDISLNHLLIVLEKIFKHGLKSKKGLFETKRDLWNVFELVERLSPDASDITTSARQMPSIKTGMGRARAWMRLALMNKRLSDYFGLLLDNREILLTDLYDSNALMMTEEAVIVGGLLVGLNILDCNLCVKEEDLDSKDLVIDYTMYLKENIQLNPLEDDWRQENNVCNPCNGSGDDISVVLDQKNYIEELNRHLSTTIANLEHKIESLKEDNTLMKQELQTHSGVKTRPEMIKTVSQSNVGSNESKEEFSQLEQHIENEIKRREAVEKELESQLFLKKEAETAMCLLERDVLEKQDSVVTLRKQLEDIKTINLQMYNKLQECETSIKNKSNHIMHLEQNVSVMANTISQLETKVTYYEKQRQNEKESHIKLSEQLSDVEKQRMSSQKDAQTEKEWRTTLQKLIDEQQEQITKLQLELENLKRTASKAVVLQSDNEILKKRCSEYELSLEEIGKQLQDSKLELDSIKENSGRLKEAVWTSDADANQCHQCSKPFSVARRRHHCRSCGKIFCSNCSNNQMPLPSNKQPVRVCDICFQHIGLDRYSTNT